MQPIDKPIRNQTASLLMAIVFCILSISLFEPLLFWVLLIAVCATAMRVVMYIGWYQPVPSSRTINLLGLLCCVCLVWFSFSIGLLLTMVNLLILAGALKLMLLNAPRDLFHLFCTALFVIGMGFTFHQSFVMTLFYGLLTLALLVALARYFTPSQAVSWHAKRVLTMGIQALPIAILLFLIVPKLPPLWKMPVGKSTETGLTDTVSPGDIASLTQSSELVFRATFEGPVPEPHERYWRAITLEQFDGKQWTVSPLRKQARQQYRLLNYEFSPSLSGSWWQYEVIAQPTNKHWLYGIDIAVPADHASDQMIWRGADYQILSESPLSTRRAYRLRSYPNADMSQTLESLDQRLNLQKPETPAVNPLTQEWAREIATRFSNPEDRIKAVLEYFITQGFTYTLTPPAMPDQPVDDFLFTHQQGFCSHYASAMAYTLRLMDIPARMVAGYHGGEVLQPGVLSVYQYDAHAWVEAWIGEQGWVRFDPTAVIAPQRIQFGIQQAVEEEAFLANNQLARLKQLPFLADLQMLYSLMDYQWSRWVLGFDAQRQQNLLALLLGKVTGKSITYLVLAIFGVIGLLLALYFIPHWRKQQMEPVVLWYQKAVTAVAGYTGIQRENLGPQAYHDKVFAHLPPASSAQFCSLSEQYIRLQYQPAQPQRKTAAFVSDCKAFIRQIRRQPAA